MKAFKWLPVFLAFMFAMSLLLLGISGAFNWTSVAAACVVVSFTFAVAIFLALTASSIVLAIGRFPAYWKSGYPPLHGLMNFGYGVMYMPMELLFLLLAMAALAAGFVTGNLFPIALERYVPGFAISLFLVLGQFLAGSISATIMMFCAGVILSMWMHRRSQRGV